MSTSYIQIISPVVSYNIVDKTPRVKALDGKDHCALGTLPALCVGQGELDRVDEETQSRHWASLSISWPSVM